MRMTLDSSYVRCVVWFTRSISPLNMNKGGSIAHTGNNIGDSTKHGFISANRICLQVPSQFVGIPRTANTLPDRVLISLACALAKRHSVDVTNVVPRFSIV